MSTVLTEKRIGGMGALPHEGGVAFRLWAPHADAVYVTGSFNNWSSDAHPMMKEGDGYWYTDIAKAVVGHEYRYCLISGDNAHGNYQIGFPSPGRWRLRLNSDWIGYSRAFGNQACSDVNAGARSSDPSPDRNTAPRDGFLASGTVNIGPYSVLVFSQDKPG